MLKRLGVRQLRPGMYIHEFIGSWLDNPFWAKSFILETDKDLNKLLDSPIAEVWIDTSRGLDVASAKEEAPSPEEEQQPDPQPRLSMKPTPMGEELQRAREICARAKTAVTSMFQEARMGKAVDVEQVAPLVEEISASVMRNSTAFISLARLKEKDDYTYLHSVAVCALMIALGRQLGINDEELRQAGIAGLLHDLGKAAIPLDILNKPGKLTDAEFGVIKGHPQAGFVMLEKSGVKNEAALEVCLHHHEKIDGSGYPHGLSGEGISLLAKMGAVCDVYDAITSNRPYKQGWDPAESLRRMAEWASGHFDQKVFHAFVKSVGIYPVGSLVKLESGLLGVVAEQGEGSLLTPKIRAFFSAAERTHVEVRTIDLGEPNCRERIVSRENAADWNLGDVSRYWAETSGAESSGAEPAAAADAGAATASGTSAISTTA